MDNPAIVAAWAAAIAALVGPIVSVAMAHYMAKQEDYRRTAGFLFRDVVKHLHEFFTAFDLAHSCRHRRDEALKLESRKEALLGAAGIDPDGRPALIEQANLIENEIRRTDEEYARAFRDLNLVVAVLSADLMSLDLVFPVASKRCQEKIRDLLNMTDRLVQDDLPERKQCKSEIDNQIDSINSEIAKLYRDFNATQQLNQF